MKKEFENKSEQKKFSEKLFKTIDAIGGSLEGYSFAEGHEGIKLALDLTVNNPSVVSALNDLLGFDKKYSFTTEDKTNLRKAVLSSILEGYSPDKLISMHEAIEDIENN